MAALAVHLKDAMNDISKNDLSSCEAMLYSQARLLMPADIRAELGAMAITLSVDGGKPGRKIEGGDCRRGAFPDSRPQGRSAGPTTGPRKWR